MEEDKSGVLQEQSEVGHEHISTLLRRRREEKGLSLQETEAATRIPVHYLQHLEGGGDPRLLADELYLVPFLRTYASFLDLDPAYAVALFVAASQRSETTVGESQASVRRSLFQRLLLLLFLAAFGVVVVLWLSSAHG
jgi:cytoskeletal protein RodZ